MVNVNLTLSRKFPLSPYSMFSVVTPGGGENYTTEMPGSCQCRLIGTVLIEGELIGMASGVYLAGYNPFELYGAATPGRGEALPPHLVFAELTEGEDSACAFLNAYGPLRRPDAWVELKPSEVERWKELYAKSPSPENYFRETLGVVPLLPDLPKPQPWFVRFPLEEFRREQSEFELTLRLYTALSSAPVDQCKKIQQTLAMFDLNWNIKGGNVERQYVRDAIDFVRDQVNSRLHLTVPRVVRTLDSTTVEGVWGCYSLLQAMYLMLFLDIASRGTRIVQCDKCSKLFYSGLQRGKYCSPECENRARALRSYHKKKGGQ